MTEDDDRGGRFEMLVVGGLLLVFVVLIGALIFVAVN
jgi:hypothetical protein